MSTPESGPRSRPPNEGQEHECSGAPDRARRSMVAPCREAAAEPPPTRQRNRSVDEGRSHRRPWSKTLVDWKADLRGRLLTPYFSDPDAARLPPSHRCSRKKVPIPPRLSAYLWAAVNLEGPGVTGKTRSKTSTFAAMARKPNGQSEVERDRAPHEALRSAANRIHPGALARRERPASPTHNSDPHARSRGSELRSHPSELRH